MKSKNLSAAKTWESSMQRTYATPAIALKRGRGLVVEDLDGKKYLDLIGGIATNLLGHAHPRISNAVARQVRTLSHTSNLYGHEPGLKLAARLIALTGDESARIYFCNSGAEAVEAAIKLSRLTGRIELISALGSFHGRTMGAISLTGQSGKRDQFRPILPKIKYLPFGDFKSILMIRRKTAMVFLEPIMGEAGVIVPPPGYLRAVRERCDEVGALLTMDCIQTGIGRTGEWFGFEDEGIKPDVITIAKGIGGGLPLGAMIALGKSAELFTPGSHGSTFGGNPIACAAANVVLDEISNRNMLRSNKLKGDLLKRLISAIPGVVEVRGKGLLVGIEVEEQRAKEIAADLLKRGFLVNSANESVIRIAPGYLITERNIETFATTLRKVCRQIYG